MCNALSYVGELSFELVERRNKLGRAWQWPAAGRGMQEIADDADDLGRLIVVSGSLPPRSARYSRSLLGSATMILTLSSLRNGLNRLAPIAIPSSKGVLKRGRSFPSSAGLIRDRSWMDRGLSPIRRTSLSRRISPLSFSSS